MPRAARFGHGTEPRNQRVERTMADEAIAEVDIQPDPEEPVPPKSSGGKLVLCSLRGYIKEIFEVSGFVSLIPIVDTLDDALKAF